MARLLWWPQFSKHTLLLYTSEPLSRQSLPKWPPVFIFCGYITNYHKVSGLTKRGWFFVSVQFTSVAQSCPTLCDPVDCSTLGFPVHHQLLEIAHVHWVSDAIQPSHPLSSPSPLAFNLSRHQGFFPVSQLFSSGGQSIGVSASASVLPMNIQDWFPLGWTGWISLLSKGLSSLLQFHISKASILWHSAFFMVQLSHPYMTTGKTIALTRFSV